MSEPEKTVSFYTLGCKVNQYDTEAMKEAFAAKGYRAIDFDQSADVYVINTCTVTGRGDAKSRQAVRRALRHNPRAIIAVTGCYSQVDPDAVASIEGVHVIAGTNQGERIVGLVEQARNEKVLSLERATDWPEIAQFEGRTRAVLKIQEGCEQYCSYCIVPWARGGLRSRDPQDVLDQVRRLIDAGFKEIVLTGVHLGAYGKERHDGSRLWHLVDMLSAVPGLPRLRLSSIEPIDITSDLFRSLAGLPAFCEHLHVPLQSGDDGVLRLMNRPYTTDEYLEIVAEARDLFPDISISTDVIVGFPGETEEQFERTEAFIRSIGFSRLHVFKFSPRKGTRAAGMGGRVHPAEMSRRSDRLISLGRKLMLEYHSGFAGRVVEVLTEESSVPPRLHGLTRNYIKTYFDGTDRQVNRLVAVRVTSATAEGCEGKLINP